MKRTLQIIALLCMAVVVYSATTGFSFLNRVDEVEQSEKIIKKEFPVSAFDVVELSGVADVEFSQSPKLQVEVSCPESLLPYVVVTSEKGVLKVDTRDMKKMRRNDKLKVKISASTLKRLSNQGVGNFKLTSSLETEQLTIFNQGVGDMRMSGLKCGNMDITNKGVGNLYLSGTAGKVNCRSHGVGDVQAKDLKATDVILVHSGVGNVTCYASKTISIKSFGVGDVSYYGKPRVLKKIKKSIGSVQRK